MYYPNIIRIKRGCLREGATIKSSPILIEPSLHRTGVQENICENKETDEIFQEKANKEE